MAKDHGQNGRHQLYRRIVTIVAVLYLATMAAVVVLSAYLLRSYNNELYASSARYMDIVSADIADALSRIQKTTESLCLDEDIQKDLSWMYDNPGHIQTSRYRRLVARHIIPYYLEFVFKNNYIRTIDIVPVGADGIVYGDAAVLSSYDTADLMAKLDAGPSYQWHGETDGGMTAVCVARIRRITNSYRRFLRIGDLFFVIRLDDLIRHSLTTYGYASEGEAFYLIQDGRVIYPEPDSPVDAELLAPFDTPYRVAEVNGVKSVLVSGTIEGTDWTYVYSQSYHDFTSRISRRSTFFLMLITMLFTGALLLSLSGVKKLLSRLPALMDRIRAFSRGKLLPSASDSADTEYPDEITQLNDAFDDMTKRVMALRDENYEKELLLRDAQIGMLSQQVNPHFLYNTLDTINWLALKHHAEDISGITRALASLFRASAAGGKQLIPLSEELKLLNSYLLIQDTRFHDRLNYEQHIEAETEDISVPALCIQPLVENAIKYGVENAEDTVTIRVSAARSGEDLIVTVENTGTSFPEDLLNKLKNHVIEPEGSGIGLTNIDGRCRLLFGEAYGLSLDNRAGCAVVTLRMPAEKKREERLHAETDRRR